MTHLLPAAIQLKEKGLVISFHYEVREKMSLMSDCLLSSKKSGVQIRTSWWRTKQTGREKKSESNV